MSLSSFGDQDRELEREVDAITAALAEQGPLDRPALAAAVHARRWGPGRFRSALQEALAEGAVTRLARGRYGATRPSARSATTPTGSPHPA